MLRFHAQYQPWSQQVAIYVTRVINEQIQLLSPVKSWSEVDTGSMQTNYEPTMGLNNEDAQALCDALAHAGIRPSEESREQQKAVQAHLDDLRQITFKQLKIGVRE